MLAAGPAALAEPIRIATWGVELSRPGPGLLLQDIVDGEDDQIAAIFERLRALAPDILLLTDFDHDPGGATLAALQTALVEADLAYPHAFARPSNAGLPSGADLDGNGRMGDARDAQGFGRFRGDGAMVLLSRLPILEDQARDLSALLWRDLPGARLPERPDGTPFLSDAALAVQRLSSTGHWIVPVATSRGAYLSLLAFAATAPVFDGPEDRNGLRNADEIRVWSALLDGTAQGRLGPPPEGPFVILGRVNVDPVDGEGRKSVIQALLADPRLQDPAPQSLGGKAAADPGHRGDPGLDTVDWPDLPEGPGNLRVDYVLPSTDLSVVAQGVDWPEGPTEAQRAASRHRLVWVDLELP